MVTLFTDSDCDMTLELCREHGFKLISMPYALDDQVIYPYVDFEHFDVEGFYEALRSGRMATTSGLTEEQYVDFFRPEFEAGNDVFYVHFSAGMTNTFEFMHLALEKLLKEFPERKFYEFDTKGISALSLSVVLEVSAMLKAGVTPEEILEKQDEIAQKTAMFFMVDDLKFFHRSGRVSGLSAMMGTLIGIRPLIAVSPEGKMYSCGKEKGRNKGIARLVRYMEELGEDVKAHPIVIGHTDAGELVDMLVEAIREKFGQDTAIIIDPTNPTIGAHCGPDTIGVAFHAKHR